MNPLVSVLMPVYKTAPYLSEAMDSMLHQTFKDYELIVLDDCSPDNAEEILDAYDDSRIVRYKGENNVGLSNVLNVGIEMARGKYIARMDSDDISLPNRLQIQVDYLEAHSECDIVGGQMTEFIDTPDNIVGRREVPLTNKEIYEFMKSRCALNHVTVMFRKEAVLKAGNYQDWFWNEDYYLWVRMMMAGCKFANIPDVAVNVRSGADQYARRGGKKYFDSEIGIKKLMLDKGMITRKEYIVNYIQRFIIQLMLPNSVRGWVFRTFARK